MRGATCCVRWSMVAVRCFIRHSSLVARRSWLVKGEAEKEGRSGKGRGKRKRKGGAEKEGRGGKGRERRKRRGEAEKEGRGGKGREKRKRRRRRGQPRYRHYANHIVFSPREFTLFADMLYTSPAFFLVCNGGNESCSSEGATCYPSDFETASQTWLPN